MGLESSRIRTRAGSGRAIGPIGTFSRVIGGVIFVAVPVALSGIDWWDVAAALIALPLASAVLATIITSAYQRLAPESWARGQGAFSGPGCILIAAVVGVGIAITFVTPVDGGVAIWTFLGASMLVAAARGYAGCEILAIPNMVRGRDDQIGCVLYTPIDAREAARSASRGLGAAGAPR
jgi:hypothetical protein